MSTEIGRAVETAVCKHLTKKGFDVLAQNWRTRWCEIDIVARCDKVVYFVEVKYRSTSMQGVGSDYVNKQKIVRMQKAAESWMQKNNFYGDARLLVATVTKDPARVMYIEI